MLLSTSNCGGEKFAHENGFYDQSCKASMIVNTTLLESQIIIVQPLV